MPISKNWSQATPKHVKKNVPAKKGIYELKCFGRPVYVGSSNDLQERLLTHFDKREPNYYRFKKVGFLSSKKKAERKHYDRYVEKHGKSPSWNQKRP